MTESLNTQSLMKAHSNEHSSLPSITVQIVEEQVQSALDAVFGELKGGAKAGRMSAIVPLGAASISSQPLPPLSTDLRKQLKEFARSQRGAKCLKQLGYHSDIQQARAAAKEQVQNTSLSLEEVFQALDGSPRAGRMGGMVPLTVDQLHSQSLVPLRDDLRKQLQDFARTENGANCLSDLGYYADDRATRAYAVAAKLKKAPGRRTQTKLAVKNILTPLLAPARPADATLELQSKAQVADENTNELWLRQQVRIAQAELNAKSNVVEIEADGKQEHQHPRAAKESSQRRALMWVASVCLLISCSAQIMHMVQNQSQKIAERQLAAGDLVAAKFSFENLIQSQPKNWEAYLGHASSIPDDHAKQVSDYKRVLALNPGEPRAVHGLAKAYYELGDYHNAIAFANMSFAQTSKSDSLEIKAKGLMRLRNFHDASKVFKQALAQPSKEDAELYYMMASCQKKLGHRDQQKQYLLKATKADPKNTSYLKQLAMLFVAENKFNDAKVTLQKAIAISADEPDLRIRLAKVFNQMKAPNRAIAELTQAIDHSRAPRAEMLKQRASLYCSINNYGHALADVDSALVLKPSDKQLPRMRDRIVYQLAVIKAGLDRQLARANRDSNDTKLVASKTSSAPNSAKTALSAVAAATPATATDTSQSQQMVLKAYKHIQTGDFKSAIPVLEAAVKNDPENSQAHRYLAFSYIKSGMVTKALSHSKQVVALGTEHPHDLFSLGEAHFYDGKPQEAMKCYRDALRIDPLHVEARMGAIRSLIALGKVEEAKVVCENAAYKSRSEKAKFQFRRMLADIKSKNQIATSSRSFKS